LRLIVGEVDEVILGKLGVQRDIHQTAVASGSRMRHAIERLRIEHAIANYTNPAGPLGDQQIAVGKECQSPRVNESFGHDSDSNLVLLGRIEDERSGAQRRDRHSDLVLGRREPLPSHERYKHDAGFAMEHLQWLTFTVTSCELNNWPSKA